MASGYQSEAKLGEEYDRTHPKNYIKKERAPPERRDFLYPIDMVHKKTKLHDHEVQ